MPRCLIQSRHLGAKSKVYFRSQSSNKIRSWLVSQVENYLAPSDNQTVSENLLEKLYYIFGQLSCEFLLKCLISINYKYKNVSDCFDVSIVFKHPSERVFHTCLQEYFKDLNFLELYYSMSLYILSQCSIKECINRHKW